MTRTFPLDGQTTTGQVQRHWGVHPALKDGSHRRSARACAAGLGFPGAALPDTQLRAVTVDNVQKADIDPGREARVVLIFGPNS